MNTNDIKAILDENNQQEAFLRLKAEAGAKVAQVNQAAEQRKAARAERHNELSGDSWRAEVAAHALVGPYFCERLGQAVCGLHSIVSMLARNATIRTRLESDPAESTRPLSPADEGGLFEAAEYLAAQVAGMTEQFYPDSATHLNPERSQM